MNKSQTETFIEERAEEEKFSYVELNKFEDLPAFLEKIGWLDKGGFLLTDSDESIRGSISVKMDPKNYLNGEAFLVDKIPKETTQTFGTVQEHNWKCAVVSNQPRDGHQIAGVMGEAFGYTTLKKGMADMDIKLFGWEGKGNHLFDSFRFFHGVATDRMYKSSMKAAIEVVSWMEENGLHINGGNVVWVGNNERDIQFGHMLKRRLQEVGFEGNFLMVKLPNMFRDRKN